jgi:hypothetical protein
MALNLIDKNGFLTSTFLGCDNATHRPNINVLTEYLADGLQQGEWALRHHAACGMENMRNRANLNFKPKNGSETK